MTLEIVVGILRESCVDHEVGRKEQASLFYGIQRRIHAAERM